MRIQIVKESVVEQETDAIVNAANVTMSGGGGVDGAILDLCCYREVECLSHISRWRALWSDAASSFV